MTPIRFIILFSALICMAGIADIKRNQWLEENEVAQFSNIVPTQDRDAIPTQVEAKSSGAEQSHIPGIDQMINNDRKNELNEKTGNIGSG